MASTEVEQLPLQKYKTMVLRVSIHCKGCERKVKKLLQSLPGVHDIEIEIKQQRVVVTGDVSPETLIRKLMKSGKHAELWPERPPEIHVQNTEKPPEIHVQKSEKPSVIEESPVSSKEIKPPATKPDVSVEDPAKTKSPTVSSGGVPDGSGGEKVAVEVKVEEKKPETGSAGNQASQPVVEKKEPPEQTEENGGGGGGGGGEGKKKKKKKSQNINKNGNGETSSSAPPPTRLPSNQSPPRHRGYQYQPPHYYTPPPAPVYTVSYNTAHPPANSYTSSYYAPPPPQSYAYSHYGSEMGHQPPPLPQYQPLDYDAYRQQPSDSFEMFSDENPNGCLVM